MSFACVQILISIVLSGLKYISVPHNRTMIEILMPYSYCYVHLLLKNSDRHRHGVTASDFISKT